MGQPVKLSDSLVLDARMCCEVFERSIARQIEFWAGIGRSVETLLRVPEILELKRRGAIQPLSECVASIGLPLGQKQLASVLAHRPFPHFEPAPDGKGFLVRIDEDGTRIVGRFVNRQYVPQSAMKP